MSDSANEVGASPAAGATDATDSSEFQLAKSDKSTKNAEAEPSEGEPRRAPVSKIKGTSSQAAMKFIVVDKEKGPIKGIIVSLTSPDGKKYYTEETDTDGYAEVLVPNGQKYDIVYLSLGRKDIAASVTVTDEPNQNIKLTLRYKRYTPPPRPKVAVPEPAAPVFILEGVTFDTGKASIRPDSFVQLDGVVEYMTYKKSARIEISGHTDNVGNAKTNKALSEKRAQACKDYLVSKGIDGSRIQAVGFGDERPIADNATEDGRQQNRRIEAVEL